MDTVLNSNRILFFDGYDVIEEYEKEEKDTMMWIKEDDLFRPTNKIELKNTLEPGLYSIGYSRDLGYYCTKMEIKSDELFIFSNTIIDSLLKEIETFWNREQIYKDKHLVHKRGILLQGLPGTGKTSIVSIIMSQIVKSGGVVFKIEDANALPTAIKFISNHFRKIQPDTPIITIIEELDTFLEVKNELLDFLDGKTHIDHHLVLATTNNSSAIPNTFLRPSRIDLIVQVDLPDEITREEYFKYKNVPEEDVQKLVNGSSGCSLADLKELYICVYVLGYDIPSAINKVTAPRVKTNYLTDQRQQNKLGF